MPCSLQRPDEGGLCEARWGLREMLFRGNGRTFQGVALDQLRQRHRLLVLVRSSVVGVLHVKHPEPGELEDGAGGPEEVLGC